MMFSSLLKSFQSHVCIAYFSCMSRKGPQCPSCNSSSRMLRQHRGVLSGVCFWWKRKNTTYKELGCAWRWANEQWIAIFPTKWRANEQQGGGWAPTREVKQRNQMNKNWICGVSPDVPRMSWYVFSLEDLRLDVAGAERCAARLAEELLYSTEEMGGFCVYVVAWGVPGLINSHSFHIIGDKLINPIVGVYIPIIRIPIKGGMTILNIATFDHGTGGLRDVANDTSWNQDEIRALWCSGLVPTLREGALVVASEHCAVGLLSRFREVESQL